MADINFSALPEESSINMGSWFRAFGTIKAIVIIVLILGFGILANIYTTPAVQTAAVVIEIMVILAGGYMAVNFNKNRELKSIVQFAADNSFEYQPGQPIPTKDLPASVAGKYTAKTVKLYYRLSGKLNNHDFELFHVRGLYYSVWNRTYTDVTVLEVRGINKANSQNKNIKSEPMDSGIRIILNGNALSAEDMEAVFTSAGIS
ncbi:MAG TPA: hypothetical protein VGR89_00830 [Puia sp.]|nr:hypothetical protein [Puia sp.]